MAAGALVDRADVHAGRAANAIQRAAPEAVGQRAGATVIQQDDVHVLRAIVLGDTGPQGGVRVHALAGG